MTLALPDDKERCPLQDKLAFVARLAEPEKPLLHVAFQQKLVLFILLASPVQQPLADRRGHVAEIFSTHQWGVS